jgi:hypothetical protein
MARRQVGRGSTKRLAIVQRAPREASIHVEDNVSHFGGASRASKHRAGKKLTTLVTYAEI